MKKEWLFLLLACNYDFHLFSQMLHDDLEISSMSLGSVGHDSESNIEHKLELITLAINSLQDRLDAAYQIRPDLRLGLHVLSRSLQNQREDLDDAMSLYLSEQMLTRLFIENLDEILVELDRITDRFNGLESNSDSEQSAGDDDELDA